MLVSISEIRTEERLFFSIISQWVKGKRNSVGKSVAHIITS